MLKPVVLTKLMLVGRRAPLDRTPLTEGMGYEDVVFKATDGLDIRGWFIPAGDRPAPAVAFVHGWLWNRLGNVEGQVPVPDKSVDFLPAAKALHEAGYGVLLFDLRHHGESDRARAPLTFGVHEARDFVGAVNYLRGRPDVIDDRIGAIGCSMGGNTAMFGIPACQPVKALLAIQPTRVHAFNTNFARDELGPMGPASLLPVDWMYAVLRLPRPTKHNPGEAAPKLGDTVVQYVQGTGDPWGQMDVVEEFARLTPNALPLVRFESAGRYEGYRYISERVDDVVRFFREHL